MHIYSVDAFLQGCEGCTVNRYIRDERSCAYRETGSSLFSAVNSAVHVPTVVRQVLLNS